MVMKIEKSGLKEAAQVLNWLIEKVGPRLPNSGINVIGTGWSIRPNVIKNTYIIELTEHVDEETQLIFMLKWS